ncbi:uncharacterized protein LOC116298259 [Actinia tenebrosa]|uniref:Uncharacterized protein LOC116298259 n=1 Tax=Actinia tenebrosa TaxID=6105 RepID=A0A6P8IB11_ACTTE|nr:uncharacterized protein LOC116298259 [Actinia tenebrosa]
MAASGLQSENCRTLIVIQISPHAVQNRNKKSGIIQETCSTICALLNSHEGGNLKLSSTQALTPNLLDELVRAIEQSLIEFLGLTNLRELCEVRITGRGKEIIFFVKPSDRIFTVNYNLALPTNFLVREVLRSEPLVNIARLLETGPLINSNLQSFIKEFLKDATIPGDLRESDTVQFKKVKSDRNKNKSLADRIISNKITHYISAFANHKGGHVYIGVDDETYSVLGENLDDKEKNRITERLESAIKNMLWPEEHGIPELGRHWNISFVPVCAGDSMTEIPGLYVIVISISACPGGVFLNHPETYIIENCKVAKMEFKRWKKRVLHDAHMQDIVKFCRENSWSESHSRFPTTTPERCQGNEPGYKDTEEHVQPMNLVVECTSIPKVISRVIPRNTKSKTMCVRITDVMEKHIQDGDFEKVQTFASKICFKSEAFHKPDIEVATRFMLALGAYRRRSFTEAYQELNKASALVTSAENSKEFEIQRLHLLACFLRGQGNHGKSYEVTCGGLQELESISPGWHSAWTLSDAGYLFSILAGEERNKEVRQSLKRQAVNLYIQAIEHTKKFGEDSNDTCKALTAKSNLMHRCHLRLAMLFLGCAPFAEKDDDFRDVTDEDMNNAVVNILVVEESVLKGDSLTEVNECYLSLAKSDINYRRSRINVEQGENYHKKAVEWATKARTLAENDQFPGILKYAQSRLDRLSTARRYSSVEEELLADLDKSNE